MRVVNVKELKARLSSYLRDAAGGATFAVTDRGRVVARLGPPDFLPQGAEGSPDGLARLVALGVRPPLRERRPSDYRRPGEPVGLSAAELDALLDDARGDRR